MQAPRRGAKRPHLAAPPQVKACAGRRPVRCGPFCIGLAGARNWATAASLKLRESPTAAAHPPQPIPRPGHCAAGRPRVRVLGRSGCCHLGRIRLRAGRCGLSGVTTSCGASAATPEPWPLRPLLQRLRSPLAVSGVGHFVLVSKGEVDWATAASLKLRESPTAAAHPPQPIPRPGHCAAEAGAWSGQVRGGRRPARGGLIWGTVCGIISRF